MDGLTRGPFQGVVNIIRFNWHFYALASGSIIGLLTAGQVLRGFAGDLLIAASLMGLTTTFLSLVISYYIYDLSGLYRLGWLQNLPVKPTSRLLNINAGFDETSSLLKQRYPKATLTVYDFYDPSHHTEVSIERARNAYPPFPGTLPISTTRIPEADSSVDTVFLFLAAHEIRDTTERVRFFTEINRILQADGYVIVVEHLRDWPNFLAYTIGFTHFFARPVWVNTFLKAGLSPTNEIKLTPFVSAFFLRKHGYTSDYNRPTTPGISPDSHSFSTLF